MLTKRITFNVDYNGKTYQVSMDKPKERLTVYLAHLIFNSQLKPLDQRRFQFEYSVLRGTVPKFLQHLLRNIDTYNVSITELMPEKYSPFK